MHQPTRSFSLEPDPRLGAPRDLCLAISRESRRAALFVWSCRASRRLADNIGHIYWPVVASTLADVAESWRLEPLIYQVGRASFVSLQARFGDLQASELSLALRDTVAWFLHIGHDKHPNDVLDIPPRELVEEADNLLGSGSIWEHQQVTAQFNHSKEGAPGERLFAYLMSDEGCDLAGWEAQWPTTLSL